MYKGIDHVGIGVSDMDRSLKFYGELLGFTQVMFDYTGSLPGMEKVTGKPETKARVVMLKNQNAGPLGLGLIKLVQLLPPDKPELCTVADSTLWGDVGIAEVCFNARVSVAKVFAELLEKGIKAVLTPASGTFPPYETVSNFAYMRDPDDGLLEFVVLEMCKTLGVDPRVEGVNHVGFGVSNMDNSMKFYRELGFTESIISGFSQVIHDMATMFPPNPPKLRIEMLGNYHGAWVEILQLLPPYKPTALKKGWGHLGAMEFAVGVSNIEKVYQELQQKGIRFLSPPQTIEVSSGQWKYVYVVEPDNLYVSLIEPRY